MDSLKGGVRRRTTKRTSKTSKKHSKKIIRTRRTSKKTSKKNSKKNSKKMIGGKKRNSKRKTLNKMIGGGPTTIKVIKTDGKEETYTIEHGGAFKRFLNMLAQLAKKDFAELAGTKGLENIRLNWKYLNDNNFIPGHKLYKGLGCQKFDEHLPPQIYVALKNFARVFATFKTQKPAVFTLDVPNMCVNSLYEPTPVPENAYKDVAGVQYTELSWDKPDDGIYAEVRRTH